jgi:hypothetical protein
MAMTNDDDTPPVEQPAAEDLERSGDVTPPADGLTVLLAQGEHIAAKQYAWDGADWTKVDYNLGFRFRPVPYTFNGLRELADLIEEMRKHSNAVIVRGELSDEARAGAEQDSDYTIARRKNDRNDGISASLVEVERQWVMVDVDHYPLAADADLCNDPVPVIDEAIRMLLPDGFHDAECFYQFSNSAGFTEGVLKVHLFFELSEPASNDHLRAVFKRHAPHVDRAVFNAVQPHYLADPVIVGGDDPLPQRTGWRHGNRPTATLPDLRPSGGPAGTGGNSKGNRGRGTSIGTSSLDRLGDGDGLDGFHAPLLSTTMQYAIRCARGGARDDVAFTADLCAKIEAAPRRTDRGSVANYTDGNYLNRLITGAFALISKAEDREHDDSARSAAQWPDGFGMTSTGLWFTDPTKEDARSEWVSAPFTIIGECEDGAGGSWGVVMRWHDPVGRLHRWIVPRAMLHSELGTLTGVLDANGLRCNPGRSAQQAIRRALASVRPTRRLHAVERAGWHGTTYVMADGTVYGSGDVILRPELARTDLASASAGSLQEWKDHVARLAVGNSRLVLFISTALAAPLLEIATEPSGGIHLHGKSQSGKSTAAYVAASVEHRDRP